MPRDHRTPAAVRRSPDLTVGTLRGNLVMSWKHSTLWGPVGVITSGSLAGIRFAIRREGGCRNTFTGAVFSMPADAVMVTQDAYLNAYAALRSEVGDRPFTAKAARMIGTALAAQQAGWRAPQTIGDFVGRSGWDLTKKEQKAAAKAAQASVNAA